MKAYFNTNTFDALVKDSPLEATTDAGQAHLLVLGAKRVDFSQFSALRAVYRFGVGRENIDFKFLEEKSIPVHFPGEKAKQILYDATANFTVYGILHMLYRGAFGDIDTWKKMQRDYIGNKVALVIGVGNIGRRVVDKLKPFMKVATYDIVSNQADELKPLLQKADIITVHIPLTEETKNFLDAEKLSWVKDDALIVNTARGELVCESALYEKLKNTRCRAFFDVFWQEPYQGRLKLLGSEKFLMTPHSASNTKEFVRESFRDILDIAKNLT